MRQFCFQAQIIGIALIVLLYSGCTTMYVFDPQYYKARKDSKKYSGTYVLERQFYDEIMQHKKALKDKEGEILKIQERLARQIKKGQNKQWQDQREHYMERAYKHSGYYSEENAKRLFIIEMTAKLSATPQVLSNGRPYYMGAHTYNGVVQIPSAVRTQIGGATTRGMKWQQIIYPQFFYIDESGGVQLISVGVIYRYNNVNKVYGLRDDGHIESIFANGEWVYLQKKKVRDLNLQK